MAAVQHLRGFLAAAATVGQQPCRLLPSWREWATSTVVDDEGRYVEDPMRTSKQCTLAPDHELVGALAARLRELRLINTPCFEEGSLVRYRRGQFYGVHGDAAGLHGPRRYTLLVSLQAAREGGATHFPHLGQRFHLAPGDALFWCNYDADGHEKEEMDHESEPVTSGIKIVLNSWWSA